MGATTTLGFCKDGDVLDHMHLIKNWNKARDDKTSFDGKLLSEQCRFQMGKPKARLVTSSHLVCKTGPFIKVQILSALSQ